MKSQTSTAAAVSVIAPSPTSTFKITHKLLYKKTDIYFSKNAKSRWNGKIYRKIVDSNKYVVCC